MPRNTEADEPRNWVWGQDSAASKDDAAHMIAASLADYVAQDLNGGYANHVMSPNGVRYNIRIDVTLEKAKTATGEGVQYGPR